MDIRFQQAFLQRKYTNDQHTNELMLSIIYHQENAKRNYNEIPLCTKWDGYNQNKNYNKCQQECRNIVALIHCVETVVEHSLEITQKVKHRITIGPSSSTVRYILKRTENRCSKKNFYMNFYSNTIHNSQKVKITHAFYCQVLINLVVLTPLEGLGGSSCCSSLSRTFNHCCRHKRAEFLQVLATVSFFAFFYDPPEKCPQLAQLPFGFIVFSGFRSAWPQQVLSYYLSPLHIYLLFFGVSIFTVI